MNDSFNYIIHPKEDDKIFITSYWTERAEDFRKLREKELQSPKLLLWRDELVKHMEGKTNLRILDIGCGAGFFSIILSELGHTVMGIDITPNMIEESKLLAQSVGSTAQFAVMDAENLDFDDNTFDVTLLFGPMYHLYEEKDRHKALDEAIRVTKPDGVLLVAFLSAHAIMMSNYLSGNFKEGFTANFDEDYKVKHFTEQAFTGFDIVEFEEMFEGKPVKYITTVAADSVLEIVERNPDFKMSDDDFKLFLDYQLHICEKREMLGLSCHLLYICRK